MLCRWSFYGKSSAPFSVSGSSPCLSFSSLNSDSFYSRLENLISLRKTKTRFLFWHFTDVNPYIVDIDKIVHACQKMSNIKQGALIIITRQHELRVIKETGQYLNAHISVELLENIFYPNSPLHDGAVIISGNKIEAARCILAHSSKSPKITANLGLRHRAAVGVTEQSDAIAIVVSEQTGKISYAENGELTRNVQPAVLRDFLEEKLLKYPNG